MSRVLIIGAGGVGRVVTFKCAQHPEIFSTILLASRTEAKCRAIAEAIGGNRVQTACVDADDVGQLIALMEAFRPKLVINVALPYQDLTIMEACLACGVHYLDTANYEPPDVAKFEYRWQWAFHERFQQKGLTAVLGCGFDPGMTNLYCAHGRDHLFDTIQTIDIFDCNDGNHGHPFATNFNPEINIREITQPGRYWEKGQWIETPPLALRQEFHYPGIGPRQSYLLYHEEEESLVRHIPGLERIRFWMTFGDAYLTHLRVLQNVGLTRIDPVDFQGQKIVPLQFLKALLPDPGSLAANYTGKTCIGTLLEGIKDGQRRKCFIYNVCDHQACYREVGAQAVSYTTGVPAALGAALVIEGIWQQAGVYNVEQLAVAPFMTRIADFGLPYQVEWY